MKSISRRIARLEAMTLVPSGRVYPGLERRMGRGRRSRMPTPCPMRVRFGNLRRLPGDYWGHRHVVVAEHLPERNGQEWVEFEEVPGPAPIQPPQDPRTSQYLDIVFVTAHSEES